MGLYDKTIGTLLVGIFFNTYLYGLVTYQFAAYHRMKFNDPPVTRYMVLFLFILDTVHSASVIYLAWNYVVTNYDNPAALAVAGWPHTFTPLATALAALVTQLYLGFCIWRLTNSKILYTIVILFALPSFIVATISTARAFTIKVLADFAQLTALAVVWLSTQVIVDMFITITLVIVLRRSRTGFRKTDTILNRFIRGAIQTGMFAGIFAISDLVTFVVLPNLGLYGMFAIPLGRIYTNTLMDTLLTRGMLQRATDDAGNVSVVIDSVYWPPTDSQAISMVHPTSAELGMQGPTRQIGGQLFSENAEGKVVALGV